MVIAVLNVTKQHRCNGKIHSLIWCLVPAVINPWLTSIQLICCTLLVHVATQVQFSLWQTVRMSFISLTVICPSIHSSFFHSCSLTIRVILILILSLNKWYIWGGLFVYPSWSFLFIVTVAYTKVMFVAGTWSLDDRCVKVPSCAFISDMQPLLTYGSLYEYFTRLFIYIYTHIFIRRNYVLEMSRLISWYRGESTVARVTPALRGGMWRIWNVCVWWVNWWVHVRV